VRTASAPSIPELVPLSPPETRTGAVWSCPLTKKLVDAALPTTPFGSRDATTRVWGPGLRLGNGHLSREVLPDGSGQGLAVDAVPAHLNPQHPEVAVEVAGESEQLNLVLRPTG